MVDMHTIGAGGGSLAYVDDAGLLHVGPQSAGADPGPACYGKGGQQVTVTDANVVLGRLQPDFALGGSLAVDVPAAEQAMDRLAQALGLTRQQAADGVLALANEHMTQALRVISIQKGFDPADFALMSFGGAGGLHVCALADNLGMTQAIVPQRAGVLSAEGLVYAPRKREMLQALPAQVANPCCTSVLRSCSNRARRNSLPKVSAQSEFTTGCLWTCATGGNLPSCRLTGSPRWPTGKPASTPPTSSASVTSWGSPLSRSTCASRARPRATRLPSQIAIPGQRQQNALSPCPA
jgi:N-methylhydantoinase A/oxoprolinase/acetone carboxylase beta subunit